MDEIKIRATRWSGIAVAVVGVVILSFTIGMVVTRTVGSTAAGIVTVVTFAGSAVGYFGFVLPRWLDEDWWRCTACGSPTPGPNFCTQCGAERLVEVD